MSNLLEYKLSEHTAWRVGGSARGYKPQSMDDLSRFIASLPASQKILWLGLGSNTLIRDCGLAELVILTQGGLNGLEFMHDGCLRAEAGVACGQLARYAARANYSGLEFLAGIPGTVGGALAMNAGCHGSETWSFIERVEMMDRQGRITVRAVTEFETAYRSVKKNPDEAFVAGHFRLQVGEKETSLLRIKNLLEHRTRTQPIDLPNCGSVFRNPPEDFAGRLIEACGLKGYSLGGAQVSTKHANFIVNLSAASAEDIEALIEHVQRVVFEKMAVALVREVHIFGERS